mmetsp:Transcript_54910/g.164408  ORF Transcript_54910/g.164408 Transcript_54910/m.164408 type:complete len:495 (-) Transcript_54910:1789-3273(-)
MDRLPTGGRHELDPVIPGRKNSVESVRMLRCRALLERLRCETVGDDHLVIHDSSSSALDILDRSSRNEKLPQAHAVAIIGARPLSPYVVTRARIDESLHRRRILKEESRIARGAHAAVDVLQEDILPSVAVEYRTGYIERIIDGGRRERDVLQRRHDLHGFADGTLTLSLPRRERQDAPGARDAIGIEIPERHVMETQLSPRSVVVRELHSRDRRRRGVSAAEASHIVPLPALRVVGLGHDDGILERIPHVPIDEMTDGHLVIGEDGIPHDNVSIPMEEYSVMILVGGDVFQRGAVLGQPSGLIHGNALPSVRMGGIILEGDQPLRLRFDSIVPGNVIRRTSHELFRIEPKSVHLRSRGDIPGEVVQRIGNPKRTRTRNLARTVILERRAQSSRVHRYQHLHLVNLGPGDQIALEHVPHLGPVLQRHAVTEGVVRDVVADEDVVRAVDVDASLIRMTYDVLGYDGAGDVSGHVDMDRVSTEEAMLTEPSNLHAR